MCQSIQSRVELIRKLMISKGLDVYIISSSDPHQSEYLPQHWQVREWVSGYTGSAGQVAIFKDGAGLWTDSRYWLQAEKELATAPIRLHKAGDDDVLMMDDFIISQLEEAAKIGLNPSTTSVNVLKRWKRKCAAKEISIVTDYELDIEAWEKSGRVPAPSQPIYIHHEDFIDRTIDDKLALIRGEMTKLGVQAHLITTLDDIAWLFNLRGGDIAHNPVFLSYALIHAHEAILYCDEHALTEAAKFQLKKSSITISGYQQITSDLASLDQKVLIDPDDCTVALSHNITQDLIVYGTTPSRQIKALKTSVQIAHIENAMVKDGIALAHAFFHMYQQLGSIHEHELAQKIAQCRSEQPGYRGESFSAIVGYEANGAIVHYRPGPDSVIMAPKGLLLCDSGGQYLDGTTDITRTMALGPTTQEQQEMYTRVLKGHIALDQAVFPRGKVGRDLDVFARMHLWQAGRDFGHGTGHGVGYFLNVHEPPQSISPGKSKRANVVFQEGMLTSNEPGYYKDGAYGIRIENLIVCEESAHEGYLRHRHLTLFPLDTSILVRSLLTKEEVRWINQYHDLVASKLLPHLDGGVKDWIEQCCARI